MSSSEPHWSISAATKMYGVAAHSCYSDRTILLHSSPVHSDSSVGQSSRTIDCMSPWPVPRDQSLARCSVCRGFNLYIFKGKLSLS